MKHILNTLTVLILTVLVSCNAPKGETAEQSQAAESHPLGQASVQDDESAKNILQVAMSSDAHTTLVAGVQAAGIEHVLVNAGPLTVFAPVNSAFDALPEGVLENLLLPENKAQLATIITRHASPGSYDIAALKKEASKGRKLYMATGDYFEIVVNGDEITIGGAKILGTIQTSNGVINVVDKVILPN